MRPTSATISRSRRDGPSRRRNAARQIHRIPRLQTGRRAEARQRPRRALSRSWRPAAGVFDRRQKRLYLDDKKAEQPVRQPAVTAGRFDFGPEMTTPPHPKMFAGEWTAEITGENSARLISQRDESTGVQLIRDFELKDRRPAVAVLAFLPPNHRQHIQRSQRILPLGPLLRPRRRHLLHPARRQKPLPQQVRSLRRRRHNQCQSQGRQHSRARRLSGNSRTAAKTQARLRLLRRLARLPDARRPALRQAFRHLSRPRL